MFIEVVACEILVLVLVALVTKRDGSFMTEEDHSEQDKPNEHRGVVHVRVFYAIKNQSGNDLKAVSR
ncbi:hypothetical protein DGG96_03575 [Legionella qingyii]|uniref:Uncharacterized protein n=1 Tax=Legionella qingyii TaxID=2184757 RepID=A0A317U7B1_9GAMM|nr:hypothetical protein DGG96_03575 [Legionella qingyii]